VGLAAEVAGVDEVVVGGEAEVVMCRVRRARRARWLRRRGRRRTRAAKRIIIAKRSVGRRWRGEDSLVEKVMRRRYRTF
jgi:hypothetical protein